MGRKKRHEGQVLIQPQESLAESN